MENEGTGGLCVGSLVRQMYIEAGLRLELGALEASNEYVWSPLHLLRGQCSWLIKSVKVVDSI